MDNENANPAPEPRVPTVDDLLFLCRLLNDAGAQYVVIGGWAIIQHGFGRATADIDLLIDSSPDNFARIQKAMLALPDGAIREVQPGDLDEYVVVRVCDEFVIDLMKAACGVEYAEASKSISWMMIRDVRIPFANPNLLWRLKQKHLINTSHAERLNLTMRIFNRRFTRCTLGYSKKLENHKRAIAIFICLYNFCRVHSAHKQTPDRP